MQKKLLQIIEASLLSASRPLTIEALQAIFEENEKPSREEIKEVLKEIELQSLTRGVELKLVSSGYRLQVRQEFSPYIAKLWNCLLYTSPSPRD